MPKNKHNIHDKFVREAFSDPKRAAASFRTILPKVLVDQLQLDQLAVLNESYIDTELNEFFSDLVFEVPILKDAALKVDIVLLFEHKSVPDKHVLIQVGYYMFAHYFKAIKNKGNLKPIIPIIYYQGKRKWKAPQLSNLFKSYHVEIKTYLPEIKHVFVALHSLSDEVLLAMRNDLMAAAMVTQKWKNKPDLLLEEFVKVFSIFAEEIDDRNFFNTIVVYMLRTTELEPDSVKKLIEAIPPNIKENIMTTYNQIIQKGKTEGKIEGKIEVVLNASQQGLPIDIIANITNLDVKEVENILKEHRKG